MIGKKIAVVGSRDFRNYAQLSSVLDSYIGYDDEEVSGGAAGADSLAQRYAKEHGGVITIVYPKWETPQGYDRGAGYKRNGLIVQRSNLVLAFYAKGKYQQGGTANTSEWAKKLGIPLIEVEEE